MHLCDAYSRPTRIELTIRKIGAEHQQNVATEHGVVARREPDQPGDADVKWIVPLDMFLAAERMYDGGLQAIGQRKDFIMRPFASRSAEHAHSTIAIEKRREPIDIDLCRPRTRSPTRHPPSFRLLRAPPELH